MCTINLRTVPKKLNVIYIVGVGRSGSSIIEHYLSYHFGATSLGEICYLYERSVIDNELCSCGKNADRCLYWGEFIKRINQRCGEGLKVCKKISEIISKIEGTRKFFHIYFGFYKKSEIDLYKESQEIIWKYIGKKSRGKIIIDSSKRPTRALLMSNSSFVNIFVIHLVRNPLATAFSWSRIKVRNEATIKGKSVMRRFGFIRAILMWINGNFCASTLKSILGREKYLFLNYEDFVKDPEACLQRIENKLNIRRKYGLMVRHSISGNPNRMGKKKPPTLKLDDEWTKKVTFFQRYISFIICFPVTMYMRLLNR